MDDKEYHISNDKSRLDPAMIHDFLANRSCWSRDIPLAVVRAAIDNSLCFGVFHRQKQVGFARVVTDFAAIAYLGDLFILEEYRGKGLGKKLVKTIMDHPELQGLRLWLLGTKDAHELYRPQGFVKVAETPFLDRFMAKLNPGVYPKLA